MGDLLIRAGLSGTSYRVSGVADCFLGKSFVVFSGAWGTFPDLALQFNSDFLLPAPQLLSEAKVCNAATTSVFLSLCPDFKNLIVKL